MKENKQNLIVRLASWVTLVVALLFVAQTGQSQVVFDNTHDFQGSPFNQYLNPGTVYFSDTNEFGDDVLLSPAEACVLTNFAIQTFVSTNLPVSGATMRLKIYANDGTNYGVVGGTNLNDAYYAPKTVLYDSGPMALKGGKGTQILTNGPTHTFTFDKASAGFVVYVPSNFTWTVSFSGLGSASAGLVQYDPTNSPYVGTDYVGFWENSGGTWAYNELTGGVPVNFGMVATKAVIAAGAPPVLAVTKVAAGFKTYTAAVPVYGTAKASTTIDGNNRIALVKVKVVGTGVETNLPVAWGGTLTAAQTWAGTIDAGAAGAVTIIFTATDAAGVSFSKTNSGTFVVTNEPLNVVVNSDEGTETATLKVTSKPVATLVPGGNTLQGLQIESPYKLTIAEPSDASYFLSNVVNSVSGAVSNRQNSIFKLPYVYNFIMKSNLTITVNLGTNRFYAVQGTYNGLFSVSNTPTISSAGWITLTFKGKTRAFSGKLNIDGNSGVAFKGVFGLDGTATGSIDRTKFTNSTLTYSLTIPFDGSDTITGTIADGGNWTAQVLADRQVTNGTDFNSRYTMVIPGSDAPSTSLTPGGDSIATVLITNTAVAFGKVSFDGTFGDDVFQSLKQTTYASKSGRIGLFAPGYLVKPKTKGFVWGWLTAATNIAPALTSSSGVTWLKVAGGGGTAYPNGFTNLNEAIVTSVYNAPSGSTPNFVGALIGLDGTYGNQPTNSPLISTYGELLFGGADFGSEQAINTIYEDIGKGKLVINKGVTTSVVASSVSLKDGKITLTITPLGGAKHAYKGVALQSQKQVRGLFNGLGTNAAESGYLLIK